MTEKLSPLQKLEKMFGMSKSEIYEALGILPEEFRRDFNTDKRKLQQINNTLLVSIPEEYVHLFNLKKGQEVILIWRKNQDSNNPLMLKV